jgi:hypothetical protein
MNWGFFSSYGTSKSRLRFQNVQENKRYWAFNFFWALRVNDSEELSQNSNKFHFGITATEQGMVWNCETGCSGDRHCSSKFREERVTTNPPPCHRHLCPRVAQNNAIVGTFQSMKGCELFHFRVTSFTGSCQYFKVALSSFLSKCVPSLSLLGVVVAVVRVVVTVWRLLCYGCRGGLKNRWEPRMTARKANTATQA